MERVCVTDRQHLDCHAHSLSVYRQNACPAAVYGRMHLLGSAQQALVILHSTNSTKNPLDCASSSTIWPAACFIDVMHRTSAFSASLSCCLLCCFSPCSIVDGALSKIQAGWGTTVLWPGEEKDLRIVKLPAGVTSILVEHGPNPKNENSAVWVMYQVLEFSSSCHSFCCTCCGIAGYMRSLCSCCLLLRRLL